MAPAVNPPDKPNGDRSEVASTRTAVAGGVAIVLAAAGWFAWSHFGQQTAAFDAFAEALGVAFGLLVFLSAIGAVVSGRRRR